MKILLVHKFHYRRGGAERAYLDTGRILADHGHEVAYFSMKHPDNIATPWEKYFVENREYNQEHTFSEKISLAFDILWSCEAQKKFTRLLDDFRPDVVHLHNISHQLSPSILSPIRKKSIPTVMTLHDYKLISPNYFLFLRGKVWEGGGIKCLLDRCVRDSFTASAVCALEFWIQHFSHLYTAVDVFLSPSDFLKEKFEASGFQGEIRRISQPIDQGGEGGDESQMEKYILYAGRLSQEKGVDVLLRAMATLPNETLCIAGDGPDREALETVSRELGMEKRVLFLGHLLPQALETQLQKAKAVIIPSLWHENMPYAVVEALALGKIVIASRMGGITERITDKQNGFLFPVGDSKALAEILEKLDTYTLSDISRRARESVRDLNEGAYYEQIMDAYTVAGKKKRVG